MSKESPFLQVLRVWAGLAWADGVIAAEEATAIQKLIAQADLGDDDREAAFGFLETPVELGVGELRGLPDEARAGIYRAAVRLAAVDRHIAVSETAFLGRLREGLGIDDATAAKIEAQVR
jgi:uncharacterized membrane protein YebE (DUF533 family)